MWDSRRDGTVASARPRQVLIFHILHSRAVPKSWSVLPLTKSFFNFINVLSFWSIECRNWNWSQSGHGGRRVASHVRHLQVRICQTWERSFPCRSLTHCSRSCPHSCSLDLVSWNVNDRSQFYQTLFFFIFQFLLLSLSVCKIKNYALTIKSPSLIAKKEKKSLFYEEKSLVGLTPGRLWMMSLNFGFF
jgi:hypothetical protein